MASEGMDLAEVRRRGADMSAAEQHAFRMNRRNQLRLLFWELTSGCNLHCIHCRATAQPERDPNELGTGEIRAVIDDIATFASPILILTGGEPLYRPDFFEIAAYATGRGLRVAMATNGTMVTPDIARRAAQAGVLRASISIDGATAATHDAFRGLPGSFARALEGAAHLRRAGVEVQFNVTVTRHNAAELDDIVRLARDRGAKALHLFMLVPVGCGVEIADEKMLPARDYERVLHWFYDQSQSVPLEFKATCAPHYFRVMMQRARAEGRQVTFQSHGMSAMTKGCLAGTAVCFISRTGRVQPCGYLPVAAGDVRQAPLSRIWQESPLFAGLRDPALLGGKCGACEYRTVCSGCRARAYGCSGDYLAEEPFCVHVPPRHAAAGAAEAAEA